MPRKRLFLQEERNRDVGQFGWGVYQNFFFELGKFRKGESKYILRETPNGWKCGSLYYVLDSTGKIRPLAYISRFESSSCGCAGFLFE